MPTYSQAGASILISAAVSNAVTNSNNTLTVYTAPADSYAIINIRYSVASGSLTLTVGTRIIADAITATPTDNDGVKQTTIAKVYVGPGQALVAANNTGASTVDASGVQFTNS